MCFIKLLNTGVDQQLLLAYPYQVYDKVYPLKGQIVRILQLQYYTTVKVGVQVVNLYLPPYNILNNIRHNSIPGLSQHKYNQQKAQSSLGLTFSQTSDNVNEIYAQQGDIIHAGRCGQNIKFSSEDGQGKLPQTKIINRLQIGNIGKSVKQDINEDQSVIWLTSNKQVPIQVASKISKKSIVNYPSIFNGKQIILNSDRILFNSKVNQIMMFAKKDIYLSSDTNICLDSKQKIILNSNNIVLGLDGQEPGVLGNKLTSVLNDMAAMLTKHQLQLSKISNHVHPVVAIGSPTLPSIEILYTTAVKSFGTKIRKILSKIIKLK